MNDFSDTLALMPNWGRVVLLGILGAVFGSFIAALVIRWPAGRSVMRGRSACDACGRVLREIGRAHV